MASLFADPNAPKPAPQAVARRIPAPKVEKPAEPRIFLVEVMNGATRKQEKFNSPEDNK
jgi:hypothetical protein